MMGGVPSIKHAQRALVGLAAIACLQLYHSGRRSFHFVRIEDESIDEIAVGLVIQNRLLSEVSPEEYPETVMPDWLRVHTSVGGGADWSNDYGTTTTGTDGAAASDDPDPQQSIYDTIANVASSLSPPAHTSAVVPFNLEDLVDLSTNFAEVYAIVVYDPSSDELMLMYDKGRMKWTRGCVKLRASFEALALMLVKIFPERLRPDQPELAFAMSSGDYPHLSNGCLETLPHVGEHCPRREAPVLQFGSAFRNKEILPNMIPMPMPDLSHLACFKLLALNDGEGEVCKKLRPHIYDGKNAVATKWEGSMLYGNGDLVFGEELGLEFEDLVPQLIWRGTDFGYLTKQSPLNPPKLTTTDEETGEVAMQVTHQETISELASMMSSKMKVKRKTWKNNRTYSYPLVSRTASDSEKKKSAVEALMAAYDNLLPRWKAVALTAAAELEAEEEEGSSLPWANMKFSKMKWEIPNHYPKGPARIKEVGDFLTLTEEYGIPYKSQSMPLEELAKYKYHIDLGGGGGTTWTGTMQKLAMPGLLFHHCTPTIDYIHNRMEPWVHYVPVLPDLSDLKEKFAWAESNPRAAELISRQATMLMREPGSREGFADLYRRNFVEPMRAVIDAYQPVSSETTWRDALNEFQGGEGRHSFLPLRHCSLWTRHLKCSSV